MKNKDNKKAEQIKTSFTAGTLTNFSGALPLYKFMLKIGVPKLFDNLSVKLNHNAKYSTSSILNTIILGIQSGMNRIKKIETFSQDPLVSEILGLQGKIDEDTISNRLKRFGMEQSNELMEINGTLSKKVHKQLKTYGDIVDIDSTVKTVYGKQEGAAVGYNPHKRGGRSYHPLMAFLNSTRECILSWLRPGDSYTSNNTPEFLKQLFSMLEGSIRDLLIRGDRGFCDDKIFNEIERRPHTAYLIKAKLKNILRLLIAQKWETIPEMSDWEMTEFKYQASGWKKERRFVALRHKLKTQKEGLLFPKTDYEYFCYVTNIQDSPLYLHKLYGDRGTSENWIEAVKNQMFGCCILTDEFWANETLLLLSVMSYNISLWMRILTDKQSWKEEPNTFRAWFVQLAGKIVHSGRRVYLKMYGAYYYKEKWKKIEGGVDALAFV